MNKNTQSEILNIINKLAPQQKIIIASIGIATLVLLGILVTFLNEPNYSVLYANLSENDAGKVIDHLKSQKIPYTFDDNGRAIKVPAEVLYESRLQLASKGIPNSGIVGYEIFDKSMMGMSQFMQKLNYKRALEGELSRTIKELEGIEAVRVHIVFPEKTIFKNERKNPTASVVVKLNGNNTLSQNNINSILNLISSSVEGLQKNKVTLIDTKGNMLSSERDENEFGVSTSKQYEIKQSVETYLSGKAQSIMDGILGYGNSIIQIDAALNFSRVEKTMELVDPESVVILSETAQKSEIAGINMVDSNVQSQNNTLANYDYSKTIQSVVEETGNIKRLMVAAVINDVKTTKKDGKELKVTYVPRTQDELNKLEVLIRNAVGIVNERGDKFSIVNIAFQNQWEEEIQMGPIKEELMPEMEYIDRYMNVFLVVIAIVISLFLLKSLMKKLKNEKIIIGTINSQSAMDMNLDSQPALNTGSASLAMPPPKTRNMHNIGDLEDEISDEALIKKSEQEKISNYVQKNPVEAAKLINSWLHEDEY